MITAQIVRQNTRLLIGRSRKRNHCLLPCGIVINLYYISYCIYSRNRGLQIFIYSNSAFLIQCYAAFFCKLTVWFYSDCKNHQICIDLFSTGQLNLRLVFHIVEFFNPISQNQIHLIHIQVFMQQISHFRIKWCHNLCLHLDY